MLIAQKDLDEITDVAKMMENLNIDTAFYLKNKVNTKDSFRFLIRGSNKFNTEILKDVKNYSSLSVTSLVEILLRTQQKVKKEAETSPHIKLSETLDLSYEVALKKLIKKIPTTKSFIDYCDERAVQKGNKKFRRR